MTAYDVARAIEVKIEPLFNGSGIKKYRPNQNFGDFPIIAIMSYHELESKFPYIGSTEIRSTGYYQILIKHYDKYQNGVQLLAEQIRDYLLGFSTDRFEITSVNIKTNYYSEVGNILFLPIIANFTYQ